MTSCCVGSGLRIDKVGMGEGAMGRAASHLRATQWFGCMSGTNIFFSTLAIHSHRDFLQYDGIDLDLKHSTDGDHNYVK